jgi:signal transduction histidine kinase
MQPSLFRQIRLATFAFLALLSIALVVSAALSIREQRRLQLANIQIGRMHDFQRMYVTISQRLSALGEDPAPDPAGRQATAQQLDILIGLALAPQTVEKLAAVRVRLELIDTGGTSHYVEGVQLFHEADAAEASHKAALLARLQRDNEAQQRLEAAAPLAILAVGILLLPLARRRIIKPLDAFATQLSRLADGDFTPAPVANVDPFLLPLHRQLNHVVARLRELELEHAQRAASLEDAVRAATQKVLAQQRALARAERLAATGELAASLAHELRNPLAGIQMTLANLRAEIGDADLGERLTLVSNEVDRLTRLLNSLLDAARSTPESARPVALAGLVDDVVALIGVQLPASARVVNRIDPALTCHLPPDRIRQALLNLLLNAGAALGEQGGAIVFSAEPLGARVRLSVCDDGPGFPAELLEGGIRPFFSTRERGTGLGLAMVRRFAREIGGEVVLENREPHGACVRLLLPRDAEG